MLKKNKPTDWNGFYLEKHRELYEDLIKKDFDSLEKETLKVIKELESFGKKLEKEFEAYRSKDWRSCLSWLLDCFNRYIDIFAKHYVLDVLILDNPKDGPVARAYEDLRNEIMKRVRVVSYKVEETTNELIANLLINESAIEFISDEHIPIKVIKYLKVIKRAERLNEYSSELSRKYYYPHLAMLIGGIKFYYCYFFHNETDLDSPQKLTTMIEKLRKILEK